MFYFYTPKTSETQRRIEETLTWLKTANQNLLMFSGGIEMEHQLKMG